MAAPDARALLPNNHIGNIKFEAKNHSLPGYTYVDATMDGLGDVEIQDSDILDDKVESSRSTSLQPELVQGSKPSEGPKSSPSRRTLEPAQSSCARDNQLPERLSTENAASAEHSAELPHDAHTQLNTVKRAATEVLHSLHNKRLSSLRLHLAYNQDASALQHCLIQGARPESLTQSQRQYPQVVNSAFVEPSSSFDVLTPPRRNFHKLLDTQAYEVIKTQKRALSLPNTPPISQRGLEIDENYSVNEVSSQKENCNTSLAGSEEDKLRRCFNRDRHSTPGSIFRCIDFSSTIDEKDQDNAQSPRKKSSAFNTDNTISANSIDCTDLLLSGSLVPSNTTKLSVSPFNNIPATRLHAINTIAAATSCNDNNHLSPNHSKDTMNQNMQQQGDFNNNQQMNYYTQVSIHLLHCNVTCLAF